MLKTGPGVLKPQIEGFQQKTAENIAQGIKDRLAIVQLPIIMHASNIFSPPGEEDKGAKSSLGTRKFAAILKKWPSILVSTESPEEKIAMVNQVSGMGIKTATKFVKRIPSFVKPFISAFVKPIPSSSACFIYPKRPK